MTQVIDASEIAGTKGRRDVVKEEVRFEAAGNSGSASSTTSYIRTVDELLAYTKVDLSVWEVERHIINKWEGFCVPRTTRKSKGDSWVRPSTKPVITELFQIKVWLRRKVIEQRLKKVVEEMLKAFRDEAPVKRFKTRRVDGHLLEVSIFDLHLGKLCWAPECGNNYDVKISQSAFTESLETILSRVKEWPIERIVFPVGNDFFNVDGRDQETTAGTPQHEDVRWQKSFALGRRLMLDAILRLREVAPVDVLMIPGNHDMERVYYLGEVLAGWLHKTNGVTVDNGPSLRKFYQYGKCMIGFDHGKEPKIKNLPLIMASEQAKMWGETTYREAHVGHWHHKKEIHFQPVDEFNGTRVRIIPSLCPADAWHRMKGYEGLRAAEAFLWDKKGGVVGSFSFNP